MYQLKKLKSLLLLLCIAVTAKAQIESGKVYNFVNVGKGTAMSISGNDVIVTLPDTRKYSQLWYAASEGNGFTLRNLANGHYLKSPNQTSAAWSTVKVKDGNCIFTATPVGGNYAIRVTGNSGGYNYMHADGGNTIVCWESSNNNSQWTMNVVSIDDATLNANWDVLASIDPSAATMTTYQTALDNLFSDKACTTLKKSFANESAVKNDADYKALPTTLQAMVLKVYKDSWAEDNYDNSKLAWGGDYAKKYRVQLYEPYNEPEAAASALGLNAHTNLNNPTGIFANDREALYVMVEGEIETGASLYLVSYTGNGELYGYNDGYELKQGLNIIPSFGDGNNYCINYVVHTFDTSKGKGNKAKAYRLSDFDDLKIHIEGGYINGYYNKMGDELYGLSGDKAADWDYVEARATQTTVTILGEYITLQFPLNDAVDSDGATQKGMSYYLDIVSVEDVIDEWDKVMLWERLVLGLLDEETTKAEAKKSPYSDKDYVFEYTGTDNDGFESGYEDYYNIHGLSLGIPNSYMYGGWRHCGYNYGTMQGIMVNMLTDAGSHWGPGHEIGHQHQNLLTVNGLTEVTNNLFANVVLWYFGETTSRVNGDNGSLSNVLAAFNTEGSDFFTNNIWALTHMYYKLFLYYHVLGHNTKFYPTLFEMLRQDPMSTGYNQNGATSLLHFYKKCCLASGDDLTEFFRAHGFFSVMDNRLVGDYSNSVYTTTQADIDDAIAEVKALDYEENIAVLFINDATGETIQSHKGDNLQLYGETTICAEVGSYASFTANTNPDYTYSVSGTTVTMEGEGGTGFAIFNEKGEIIAFSDKKTFNISSECAAAIASGKAEIKTVQADNTVVEATDVMDTDNIEAKRTLLGELLNAAKAVTDLADETGKKVGYYRPASLTDLTAAYAEAKTVYDNQTSTSYAAMYDVLFQAYTEVVEDDFARIGIIEGNAYQLTNKYHSSRSMAVNTNNNQMSGVATADTDEQKWYFEASNSLGRYYLKNKATNKYPGNVSTSAVLSADKDESSKGADDGAAAYELRDMGSGVWALVNDESLHCASSQSYNIVGWGADADASQWYITAVDVDQNAEALHELQTLIEKTELLVDEMATVEGKGAVEMSTCNITSNATETGHETRYLTDGNPLTFFHTVWSGTAVNAYHNIVIDLGEGKSLTEFVLNYTTLPSTSHNVDAPQAITIMGSNNGSDYTSIANLSSGLPNTKGAEYTSSTLGTASSAYRYIRLQVTSATGGTLGGYYYFGLAELGLARMTTVVESIGDKYTNFITAGELTTICDQLYDAKQAYASGTATTDDIEALQAQYDILLAAHKDANDVEFNAKKQELFTLIGNTNSLISTCGRVIYTPATLDGALALQTSNSNGSWYVSTNADQNTGGGTNDGQGIAALVDNNYNTYFHTRWDGTVVNEPHYIQVDMGEGVAINDFVFSYKPRNGSPAPTAMTVYGSDKASSFTDVLTTITSGLPAHNSGSTYTSSTIVSDKAYRYLRFVVTGSRGPGGNQYNGQYFFGMLELDLTAVGRPESYTAELNSEPGDATPELLLTTYHAANEAKSIYDNAKTKSQVQDAIDALQAQYDALYNAKYPSVEFAISSNAAHGGVTYKGVEYTSTLNAPYILSVEEITAIDLTDEGYVAKSVTLNDRTITVIYNKVYIVEIVGGEGKGRVTFGNSVYDNNGSFDAEQGSFTNTDLAATDVEGYNKSEVTVNHETGVIRLTYTLDTSALNTLIGETNDLVQACQGIEHSTFVTEQLLTSTSAAITSAMETMSKEGLTYEEYTVAVAALQTAKTTLAEAKTNAEQEAVEREAQRATLNELIAQTNALIEECGVVVNGRHPVATTPVALQTTDKNAAYYLSTNAQQSGEGPIANLLDGSTGSYFHSNWSSQVGEAHRLQVDMGAGHTLKEFAFSYTTRDNGTGGPHPSTIVVSGSNSAEGTFVDLATINSGLPTTGNTAWNTANENVITASEAYRYLRFTVTASAGTNGCKHGNNEYFFAMSEFSLSPIIYETSYFVESMLSYGNVTEEQLIDVAKARDAAEKLAEESYDKTALEAQAVSLQTLYQALLVAHNDYSYLPVTLTANMENPVLYVLNSKRGSTKVLQYDPADEHMFSIADAATGTAKAKQLFYFTKGTKHGQVFIHPFAAGEQVLAAKSTANAKAAVWATPKGTMTHQEWTIPIVSSENGTYNIKAADGSNYFSNNSGVDYKMGFWSGENTTDLGSLFTFTQATIDGSSAYYSLKVYYNEALMEFSNKQPGYYGPSPEFEEASATAEALLDVTADYATYLEAYHALRVANESPEIIKPEEGKFYRIKNNGGTGYLSSGTGTDRTQFVANIGNAASSIFYYTGGKLLSFANGMYLANNGDFLCYTNTAGAGTVITFKESPVEGKLLIEFKGNNGDRSFYSAGIGNSDAATSGQTGDSYRFTVEEVTSLPVTISKVGFATFYTPVALAIPEDVSAYVGSLNDAKDELTLIDVNEKADGIPAETGVVLYRAEGRTESTTHNFDIVDDLEAVESAFVGNVETVAKGSSSPYTLQTHNGGVAFKLFTGANVTGFKAYLDFTEAKAQAIRIRFGKNEGTTEIEPSTLNSQPSTEAYDLMGRRVLNPMKGMYIVNGKKFIVK